MINESLESKTKMVRVIIIGFKNKEFSIYQDKYKVAFGKLKHGFHNTLAFPLGSIIKIDIGKIKIEMFVKDGGFQFEYGNGKIIILIE